MNFKNIIRPTLITIATLFIPLIAMQFSEEVDWKLPDFIVIGTLVFGTGVVYEFLAIKTKSLNKRIVIGTVLLAILLLAWAELAVGVFNSPFAGQ